MLRMGAVGVLLALAVGVAGCGSDDGGGSDEDQVREVVESFQDAALAGDDDAACELLTEESADSTTILAPGCQVSDYRGTETLGGTEITNVAVSGETATVSARCRRHNPGRACGR